MGQAKFPPGLSKEFPPEEPPNPIGEIIGGHIKRISDLFGADEEKREAPR